MTPRCACDVAKAFCPVHGGEGGRASAAFATLYAREVNRDRYPLPFDDVEIRVTAKDTAAAERWSAVLGAFFDAHLTRATDGGTRSAR